MVLTVALLPALFPGVGGADEPSLVRAAASGPAAPVSVAEAPAVTTTTTSSTITTTTTVAPAPTTTAAPAPTTTVAPRPATTTTTARPTTTTTSPPPPPPPPAASAEGGSETGKASWYDHRPGICAHKTLPFGTVVTVTHTGNGRRTTCTVGDRGPYIDGWIIDLHPDQFDDLAPTSTGVIPVRITWG